jgi:glycosyltransferase involved in cell wall biosynthesis
LSEAARLDDLSAAPPPRPRPRIAVVIPCYRAASTIGAVVAGIGPEAARIFVVDDDCPEGTGARAFETISDPRLTVLSNPRNLGVGGAVKRGYRAALADGADIVVKIDADGQMDPRFIGRLVAPVAAGEADYAKGNRFARRFLMPSASGERRGGAMPMTRRVGNNLASFLHKGVTGQWGIVDPANGFTAIHRRALEAIDLDAAADCYFFETDMLFQLGLADAVVKDVPLPALYAGEVSSLRVRNVVRSFPLLALRRFAKRIAVRYFLNDFNVASLELVIGIPLLLLGAALGLYHWVEAVATGVPASAGTVMFAALPIILGFQLLLSAISYDVAARPAEPLSRRPPAE